MLWFFWSITLQQHYFSYTVDYAYEGAGKHTYLPMLILVALIFPLWLGLLFLYPWLAGKHSRTHKSHVEDRNDDDDEHKELIPASELKPR